MLLRKILQSVPLKWYKTIVPRKVVGVNYHMVSDADLHHVKHLFKYKSVREFEEDLKRIKNQYNLISYQQYQEGNAPRNSMLLTFDDGYEEMYSVILPLLKKHKIPAIYFIITDLIDNKSFFYRNQISLCIEAIRKVDEKMFHQIAADIPESNIKDVNKDEFIRFLKSLDFRHLTTIEKISDRLKIPLQPDGKRYYLSKEKIVQLYNEPLITIGAHSLDHREMFLFNSKEEVEQQIVDSCLKIKEITGQEKVPFSFPYTSKGVDRSLLRNLQQKHAVIADYFGESSLEKKNDIVITRFPGEKGNAKWRLEDSIKLEYIYYIKGKLKKSFMPA